MNKTYYLKADHQLCWDEVTFQQYRDAEENVGFHIKYPSGNKYQTATGGFSSCGISGKIEEPAQ